MNNDSIFNSNSFDLRFGRGKIIFQDQYSVVESVFDKKLGEIVIKKIVRAVVNLRTET